MKITKEEKERILKLDPDFFKVKLEVGKWYRRKNKFCNWLMNYQKDNTKCYGFNSSNYYSNNYVMESSENWIEATEQEVFEALKNESIKKYKKEDYIIDSIGRKARYTGKLVYHNNKENNGITNGENMWIMRNGTWATIIEKITKEEAEKILNKKII